MKNGARQSASEQPEMTQHQGDLYPSKPWWVIFFRMLVRVMFGLTLVMAIYVFFGREGISLLPSYHSWIEDKISETVGADVSIGEVKGYWQGFSPLIRLDQLSFQPKTSTGVETTSKGGLPQSATIHVKLLEFDIDLIASLLEFQPKLNLLRIKGLELNASDFWGEKNRIKRKNHEVKPKGSVTSWQDKFVYYLFQNDFIEVLDAKIWVRLPSGDDYRLDLDELLFRWQDKQFSLRAKLSNQENNSSLALLGQLSGRPTNRYEVDGNFFVDIKRQDLTSWIDFIPVHYREKLKIYGRLPVKDAIETLEASLLCWFTFESGSLNKLQTEVEVSKYKIKEDISLSLPEKFRFRARWHDVAEDTWRGEFHLDYSNPNASASEGSDQEVYAHRLKGKLDFKSTDLPLEGLGTEKKTRHYWTVALSHLELPEFFKWVHVLGLKKRLDWLPVDDLKPAGVVDQLVLSLPVDILKDSDAGRSMVKPAWLRVKWRLLISGLGFSPQSKMAGISGLNFSAWGKYRSGAAKLEATALKFELPNVFRQAHENIILKIPIKWQLQDSSDWLIETGVIKMATPDIETKSIMSLKIPGKDSPNQFTQMSLLARLYQGEISITSGFLPVPILPKSLVRWLDDSLVKGDLVQGDILYHGRFPQIKEDGRRNRLQMRYMVDEGEVKFHSKWPAIQHSRVDAFVDGPAVFAKVFTGEMLGAQIKHATVDLPRPKPKERPVISVIGKAEAKAFEGLNILKNSPVNNRFGAFFNQIDIKGEVDTDIKIKIPLKTRVFKNKIKPNVKIGILADDIGLKLKKNNLYFKSIDGLVTYQSGIGLKSKEIKAQLFDKAVTGKIDPILNEGAAKQTRLTLSGAVDVSDLAEWRPLFLYQGLTGNTHYHAQLDFPINESKQENGSNQHPMLSIRSDLEGISWSAPNPLGKDESNKRDFKFFMEIGRQSPILDFHYDKYFRFRMQNTKNGFERGTLQFGVEEPKLLAEPGLSILGHIDEMNLVAWRQYFDELKGTPKQRAGRSDEDNVSVSSSLVENKKVTGTGLRTWYEWINTVDLSVAELDAWHQRVFGLRVQVLPFEEQWVLGLHNESVSGVVKVPIVYLKEGFSGERSAQLDVDLASLNLNLFDDENRIQIAQPGSGNVKTIHWCLEFCPPFKLNIRVLRNRDDDWGQWTIYSTPVENGLDMSQVSVQAKGLDFFGNMKWLIDGDVSRTYLSGDLAANDVSNVMKNFGFSPSLTSKAGAAELDLQWAQAPWSYSWSKVSGKMNLRVREGQLLSVDNAASSLKVVGLLNFNVLQRRLQLDFSDVYKKGLPYDEIVGDFQFSSGKLVNKKFSISGPSTEFESEGKVNLISGDIKQELSVTVPVSRNLIIPAAAAGGLPAAATLYVIDKALGEQLDKLTTLRFQLEGHWNDPKVKRVKLFK